MDSNFLIKFENTAHYFLHIYIICKELFVDFRKLIFSLIFLLLFPIKVFAQDLKLDLPYPDTKKEIKLEIDYTTDEKDPFKLELYKNPEIYKNKKEEEKKELDYRGYELPAFHGKEYWNDYIRQPHVYYITKYAGFESVIHDQIRRLAMRYYNQEFNTYQNNQDNPIIFWDRINNIYSSYEHRGFSNFSDYLPVDKGGAHFEENTIGKDLEIFQIGCFSLTNVGKINIIDMSIDVETQKTSPAASQQLKLIDQKPIISGSTPEEVDLVKTRPVFNLKFFKRILNNEYFEITGNIKFNLRVDQFDMQNKSGLTASVKLVTFYKRRSWMDVQIKATAQPLVNDYSAEFYIQLLTF